MTATLHLNLKISLNIKICLIQSLSPHSHHCPHCYHRAVWRSPLVLCPQQGPWRGTWLGGLHRLHAGKEGAGVLLTSLSLLELQPPVSARTLALL